MNRCLAAVAIVVVATSGLAACGGGSSGAPTRTVNGCEIKPRTSCAGANLAGAKLSLARLAGADLRRADLRGADLSHTDLRHARLQDAKLNRADLNYSNLTRANLRGADLDGVVLFAAVLIGAKVNPTTLNGTRQCLTKGITGVVNNSGCKAPTTSTTTTKPAVPVAPAAPFAVKAFTGPTTYSCTGKQRRKAVSANGNATATFSWSVPRAVQSVFTFDGIPPSSSATNLPAVVDNPSGQSGGEPALGTVTFEFACDRKPHVASFAWTEGTAAGAAIPGAATVTRNAPLTYVR